MPNGPAPALDVCGIRNPRPGSGDAARPAARQTPAGAELPARGQSTLGDIRGAPYLGAYGNGTPCTSRPPGASRTYWAKTTWIPSPRACGRGPPSFAGIKGALNGDIHADRFAGYISTIEEITRDMARIGGQASLTYTEDTQSEAAAALKTRTNQLQSEVANHMVFFDLWWKRGISDADAARLAGASGDLETRLMHKRRLARHALSEAEEKVVNLLDVTGASALVKIYDTITNAYAYTITVDGSEKTMGREELTAYVRSPVPKYRESAYRVLLGKYAASRNVLGEIYHNVGAEPAQRVPHDAKVRRPDIGHERGQQRGRRHRRGPAGTSAGRGSESFRSTLGKRRRP